MNKKSVNFKNNEEKSSIEVKINNIFHLLCEQVSESSVVVKEKLSRWACCKGIISVYSISDVNNRKADPIASFAFYPSIYEPTERGSIAIYVEDAKNYLDVLRRRSSLFVYEIKEVRAEIGRRLFVDVRLFS